MELWQSASGQLIRTLSSVDQLPVFTPDGQTIIFVQFADLAPLVWEDVHTGETQRTVQLKFVQSRRPYPGHRQRRKPYGATVGYGQWPASPPPYEQQRGIGGCLLFSRALIAPVSGPRSSVTGPRSPVPGPLLPVP